MKTHKAIRPEPGRANTARPAAPSSRKGLIIVPDISGFTNFVHHTEFHLGRQITAELLTSILEHNVLDLQVSEIEGDAVLFYRCGPLPPMARILDQYEHMLAGFNHKLAELNQQLTQQFDLTLKLVAHYGDLAEYQVGGFRKLYGESVIEAHRLLKNSIHSHTYALITDDLVAARYELALLRRPGCQAASGAKHTATCATSALHTSTMKLLSLVNLRLEPAPLLQEETNRSPIPSAKRGCAGAS